jgi:[calcium/calmodulin-dependent protein kinase] kinase
MSDTASPTRDMRIAEFPDSSTGLRRVSSTSSTARLREKKLRTSVGTSDLTRPRLSFADSLAGDYDDADAREHFTVDTIMVTHKETKDSQQQLNQYIVGEMIGKGSYGMVLKCTNVIDKKDYALKVISKHNLRKASVGRKLGGMGKVTLQAVKHEIAILKKVNHRNIVKLLEVSQYPLNYEHVLPVMFGL